MQLRDAIEDITKTAKPQRLAAALPVFGAMLRCLKLAAPALHRDLNRELDEKHLLDLIEANGTVFELFKLVEHASPRLRLSNRTLPILRNPVGNEDIKLMGSLGVAGGGEN